VDEWSLPIAHVLIPLPSRDFDPTEIAVSWHVLTALGHRVTFATPNGKPGEADPIMISGKGLDPWSLLPLVGRIRLIGLLLRANANARRAYARMIATPEFRAPQQWRNLDGADYDGLLLGGGHRARGMCEYLESDILQRLVAGFFAAEKPVAAICHGVLLAARSRREDGKSVLFGRKTTSLMWAQERAASGLAHVGRWWDRNYYRTYLEQGDEPAGYMSVEQEVTRNLADPADFLAVPRDHPEFRRKTQGLARDTMDDDRAAWVVRDGHYVSARWPGDAHSFARTFASLLPAVN
jgi:putative intracellular protease/amidase